MKSMMEAYDIFNHNSLEEKTLSLPDSGLPELPKAVSESGGEVNKSVIIQIQGFTAAP